MPDPPNSAGTNQRSLSAMNGDVTASSRLDRQSEALLEPESAYRHGHHAPYQQLIPIEGQVYPQDQMLPPSIDFPMNWLPPDLSLAIDYDNIVGLGVGSLDFFTLPNIPTDGSSMETVTRQGYVAAQADMGQAQPRDIERGNAQLPLADGSRTWNNVSPQITGSHVSSLSPYSPAHTISPSEAPGGLYATSINGARMPCTTRARRANRLLPGGRPLQRLDELQREVAHQHSQSLSFPDASHIMVEDYIEPNNTSRCAAPHLARSTYEDILQGFNNLCLDDSFGSFPYSSSRFPDILSLNMCIRLYFENFDTTMPIFHNQVTQISDHWMLALAVSAVGCQYAEAEEYAQMVEPLHEFLRRAIAMTKNTETMAPTTKPERHHIAFAQASLLNQVGMLYSGSPRLLHFAKAQHSGIVEVARATASPTLTTAQGNDEDAQESSDVAWRDLLFGECKRRIGYSIWLLDCMSVYHFTQQLLMPPTMMSAPLPNDRLWQSVNAADWFALPASSRDTPSLTSATAILFREKTVVADLGQFGRVILLHGVYREIFQLKDCFAGPLGNWVPSIQQQAPANSGDDSASLPISHHSGRNLLNSWRNAGLDCVDVLHWAANGTIALQAGAEHPLVLHLHLSRTILLAPFDQFQALVLSVVTFAQKTTSATLDAAQRQTVVDAERDILDWAQRDQCKARLAVLHSGCLFWHIRRYSCRAFYEPTAIFLATLTIWAYSSYASRATGVVQESSNQTNNDLERSAATQPSSKDSFDNVNAVQSPSDGETEQAPTFIHLDRPNDDEMVQVFVRFGTASAMRANIAGVGDIYSAKGPARVLKEGRKILTSISTAWGRTDRFSSALEVLEQVALGRMT